MDQGLHIGQADLVCIVEASTKYLQVYPGSSEEFYTITSVPNQVKFSLDKSPSIKSAERPTDCYTIRERTKHGNGKPPSIVGRLCASGESGSLEPCDSYFNTHPYPIHLTLYPIRYFHFIPLESLAQLWSIYTLSHTN